MTTETKTRNPADNTITGLQHRNAEQAKEIAEKDKRIGELERERDEAKAKAKEIAKDFELAFRLVRQENDRLTAELAVAQADSRRVDWLAEELKKWRTGMVHTAAPSHQPDWLYYVETDGRYDKATSIRAAIDAAMSTPPAV